MPEKVLIVDDEHDIADLIEVYLQNENYTVYKFYSSKEALVCIESEEVDLAILDIMLPDISGFSLCQKIREKYTYPIIMLTAKDDETDKITGLTLGADDYVTKPFRPLELIARVKAQLRRYKKYSPMQAEIKPATTLSYEKLLLDTQTYECSLDGIKRTNALAANSVDQKIDLLRKAADLYAGPFFHSASNEHWIMAV